MTAQRYPKHSHHFQYITANADKLSFNEMKDLIRHTTKQICENYTGTNTTPLNNELKHDIIDDEFHKFEKKSKQ